MKRMYEIFWVLLVILAGFPKVAGASPLFDGLIITELQTGSLNSASEEFIELYNASSEDIDVSNWQLEYFTSSASNFDNPSRIIPLHGVIESQKYFLVTSSGYLSDQANETFTATLAKSGGHVRLARPNGPDLMLNEDLVGWGSALHPEGLAAAAPPDGQSLIRKTDIDGNYQDSDNNKSDFQLSDQPNPQSDPVLTSVVEDPQIDPNSVEPDASHVESTEAPESGLVDEQSNAGVNNLSDGLAPPQLSELFPNQGSLAATQITFELNYFATFGVFTQQLPDLLCFAGTGGFDLQGRLDIHTKHMLPRGH